MKKIFILTGEPSGDKLASKVISKLQKNNPNIEYACVGGTHLNSLGIKSIFKLKEITHIGFTSVLLNIFKIKNKIDKTVEEIIRFNPDILFSVDSPDFTLRVAEKVKKLNNDIKTIHYVAPQVWVWREGRVKKFKKFLDHVLLLFDFEKKYFDKENIPNTFVGHPLLEEDSKNKIDLTNIISNDKKIISLERFIYSLGIRHIGQENTKLIARHLKTSSNFFRLSGESNIENLSNIDGIGITQIQSIKKFFLHKTNLKVLSELEKILLI